MADVSIPREAVDKAARAFIAELNDKLGFGQPFDELPELQQRNARETATVMLNAAAPLIVAAEIDRWVIGQTGMASACACASDSPAGPHSCQRTITWQRARAAELRAQS